MPEINPLLLTAALIGMGHTLLGPDHYLPFIMLSWSRKWSALKTAIITLLCGIGHVLSSVILGIAGIAVGIMVGKLEQFEAYRGTAAAWLLIAFGLAYLAWGIRQAYRNRPHKHPHIHYQTDPEHDVNHTEIDHQHPHTHHGQHAHIHDQSGNNTTAWALFIIFIFGPCEPLIPILMYPAAKSNMYDVLSVTVVFALCTIGTMLAVVLAGRAGVDFLPTQKVQRYSHAFAGAAILACGLAIKFLGI